MGSHSLEGLERKIMRNKYTTIGILIVVVLLAVSAVVIALRLQQSGTSPVAPNAPESKPKAQENEQLPNNPLELTFTVSSNAETGGTGATPTPSPRPTASPTPAPGSATATPTPTPTSAASAGAPNSCNGTCGSNSNCIAGFVCSGGFCRNPSCTAQTDCTCAASGASATSAPKGGSGLIAQAKTPTPAPAALPKAGVEIPSVMAVLGGIAVLFLGLALVL